MVLPTSEPEPDTTGEAVDETPKAPENVEKNVDIPTSSSPASGAVAAVSPVIEESSSGPVGSVAPIAAEAISPDDSHTIAKSGEPAHVDVGDSIADAKSDSGTTAVADPEPTADVMHAPLDVPSPISSSGKECDPEVSEKKKNKPSSLPSTPKKGEVFPSVSPPSSPSRFSSLRGSGKKKRTASFFAKLKEVFKSDKEKAHSSNEKAATKN